MNSVLLLPASVLFLSVLVAPGQAQPGSEERLRAVESQVQTLQKQIEDMRKRSALFSITEEVKQFKEYVCAQGHLYETLPAAGTCPVDATQVKERRTYRKVKLARQESIAEQIGAALEEAEKQRVLVGASATGIFQQVGRSRVPESTHRLFTEGSVDLFFVSRPAAFSTLFINLEGIGGGGPDEMLDSLSGLNEDAARQSPPEDRITIREAWLRSELWGRRLQAVVGKVDLGNYFDANRAANDETTQFVTSVFVNNPILENPPNGPGVNLFYDPGQALYAGLGIQGEAETGSTRYKDVYAIVEAGARLRWLFDREGTYRLWVRRRGQSGGFARAMGISLDQRIWPQWIVFARVGATERGLTDRASAWSVGASYLSPFGRSNDQMGVGFSRFEKRTLGRESAAEIYYRFFITDHLAVTPHIQGLFDSVLEAGPAQANPSWVFGARAQINF